jgi:TetR/AcrR family transcriptional regulator, transcriptional repressor for nem operon
MASPRRVGTETSKTRDLLLDCVERLLLAKGYAGVSYRVVAAEAGVTAGLVQYYFPTLDDLFVAVVRRRSQQNLDRLTEALHASAGHPLRVIWEFSRDEMASALSHELLALGNHRPSIRSELTKATEQVRRLQLEALAHASAVAGSISLDVSPATLLFLLSGVPKLIRLEEGVGVTSTHDEVLDDFVRYLDGAEPLPRHKRGSRG